ncbi:MAG: cache domain-containing protein, partial [Syntrophales bacterium]
MTEKEPRKDQGKGDRQMTTTPRRPTGRLQKASAAIFQWRSLRTRVTLLTLAIFVIGIWALAFYASHTLQRDMEKTLSDQQFSAVSILAADINDELENRLKTLEMIAEKITPTMLGNAAATQTFLDSHISFKMLFNYGGVVMRLDGVAIAETPNHGRIGLNYSDRDHVVEALKGKTTIGKPVMGKTAHSPILSCAAPIRDAQGKVIGAVSGVTDLGKPNFLTKITDHGYGKTGGYLMVSLKTRTIVYATDKKRIMEVLPGPGFNPLIDRAIKGWEGSGITIRPSTGVEILSSVKGIPIAGWYAAAMMPTAEAFAPVHALQKRVLLATIFLTLLAGCLTWWMLKRQLAPALTTIKTLATLADADETPAPLPITRQDEIGELIGGFNRLLEILGKREEALRERVKELSCLYSITDLLAENNHIEEALQKIVNQIPSGWYYPEQACARIILHNNEFSSTNFQETAWKLSARIMDTDKMLGVVEVHYRENIPDRCEDPFLKEERSLINAIAEHLGRLILRKAAEEELAIKQRQLQTLNETLA